MRQEDDRVATLCAASVNFKLLILRWAAVAYLGFRRGPHARPIRSDTSSPDEERVAARLGESLLCFG
jgi:hypothetical protein